MKASKILPFVFVAACLPALQADAQSVAQPVIPGYNSLSCGTGPSPCFVPWGSAGGGYASNATASITRPANTTTYSANTAWANATASAVATEITGVCQVAGGRFLIPQLDVWSTVNPSTKLQGVIWLFSAQPSDPIEDNATFTIPAADFLNLTGNQQGFAFTLTNTQAAAAANSGATLAGTVYTGQCGSTTTSVWMMAQVVNAYVPGSSEVLRVRLHTLGTN